MAESKPGRLKIFLGYAAGVGKTYRMLSEALELKQKGVDIVIGYFEPHARKDTMALAAQLETVPRRQIQYRGVRFHEMDTAAILLRRPRVCLVDEFAHTNVPGSARTKRWQDVQVILGDGIDVFTTMNVQHLESLNDDIWRISGVRVRETVPDWVVRQASEVVMVDLTTGALLNRLERGVIYEAGKARQAMANFFQESTLAALRELALRQTAHELESRQGEPAGAAAPATVAAAGELPAPAESHDRILILVTADATSAMVIRRGWRVANYLHADCYALYVQPDTTAKTSGALPASANIDPVVKRHLAFARDLRIQTHTLAGHDVAATLVAFAKDHQVTQIFVAQPESGPYATPFVRRLVRLASDMQVTVVAEHTRAASAPSPGRPG